MSKFLGQNLPFDDRILLAQLTQQPGWRVFVKLLAEACRTANEEVIKVDPTIPRYPEVLTGLQTTARAINMFSSDILASMKAHFDVSVKESKEREGDDSEKIIGRFQGFRMPDTNPKSPAEGAQ